MRKIAILVAFCISGSTIFAAEPAQTGSRMPDSDSTSSLDDDSVKMRLIYGSDRWVELHSLVQVAFGTRKTWDTSMKSDGVTQKETKKQASWSKDASLNAARISLNGQLGKDIYFFLQTDDLKAGTSSKNGDNANDANGKDNMFVQDAYVKFEFFKPFQLYSGLLTVPRDRQNLQSQATMLTANGQALVRSSMNGFSDKGRDLGVMFRGLIPGKNPVFEYRLGAFRGLGKKLDKDGNVLRNKKSKPRLAGRIQFTAGDTEDSYFLSENYLGKKNIFSFGAGGDYQPDQRKVKKDYYSFGADLNFDSRVIIGSPYVIAMQFGFIKAGNLPDTVDLKYKKYYDIYGQAGLLAFGALQPTCKLIIRQDDYYKKTRFITPGLNYYFNEHFANIKLEFDIPVSSNKKRPDQYQGTLQFQGYL